MDTKLRNKYFLALDKEVKSLLNPKTNMLDEKYSQLINCPLCNAEKSKHKVLFVKNGYTFVRCENCEMIFSNPQVKERLLHELYGKSISNDIWVKLQNSKIERIWKKEYFLDIIKILKSHTKLSNLKILDVGCSTGYFMELVCAKMPKWEIEGLEINEMAHKYINKKFVVYKEELNRLPVENRYDVVTLFGVLEHLPKPIKMLNDIKLHLNKDGLIMAIVPNAYSLYHMFLQDKSLSFDGRNHILFFSAKTIKRLFEDNGFKVVSLDTVLTGLGNIRRQMQWYDPNDDTISTNRYITKDLEYLFKTKQIEKYIYKFNLGLRLRIVARKYSRQ